MSVIPSHAFVCLEYSTKSSLLTPYPTPFGSLYDLIFYYEFHLPAAVSTKVHFALGLSHQRGNTFSQQISVKPVQSVFDQRTWCTDARICLVSDSNLICCCSSRVTFCRKSTVCSRKIGKCLKWAKYIGG